MILYFELQYKRFIRRLRALGINPYIALVLITILFFLISKIVYSKLTALSISYSQYIYALFPIIIVYSLGEMHRNEFLKTVFPLKRYLLLRLLENSLVALPFCIFLVCAKQLLSALVAWAGSLLLVFVRSSNFAGYVIPTPFSKRPFEFSVGFRQTYLLIIGSYLIAFIGIAIGNYNLGLVMLIILFLTALNYYAEPEPPFYVWIYSLNARQFLGVKVKQAFTHSLILTLPLALALILMRTSSAYMVVLILIIGLLYMLTWVLGKYAIFPKRFDLPQSIKLILGFVFPPILFILIPHFYIKSIQRLTIYLK